MDLITFLLNFRKSPVLGIVTAAALLAIAIMLRMYTPVTLVYATFYPAVILATLAGGRIIGIAAMLASSLLGFYFFVSPDSQGLTAADVWNALAFWVVSLVIIFLTDLLVDLLLGAQEKSDKLAALNRNLVESERQKQDLMRELSHRMKNQYAVILAMVRASERTATSAAEFTATFSERLQNLARAHDLLTNTEWKPVALLALVKAELAPFIEAGRLTSTGPDVKLNESAVVYLGMALHELATNATKHGAWSNGKGRIVLSWKVEDGELQVEWQEQGGPPAAGQLRNGFGRTVLENIVGRALDGSARIEFTPQGLHWYLKAPASCLVLGEAART
jgi:two-component sensor histidine kinase